jgi:hypothetical protein
MVQTAAHLADHVMPRLPVRQWVLSVPKRLRTFLSVKLEARGRYRTGRLLNRRKQPSVYRQREWLL